MVEIYMRLVDLVLTPVLLLVSVILLLRGHDMPGGGFIAGLLATSAFIMQILAHGADYVRKNTGRFLMPMIGAGLVIAVVSATLGAVFGSAFFKGMWVTIELGPIHYKIGTPVTFDVGVFLTVIGVSVTFLLGLSTGVMQELPPPPEERPEAAANAASTGSARAGSSPTPGAVTAAALTGGSTPSKEASE